MWLLLANGRSDADRIEQTLSELEALTQFMADVRRRLGDDGIEGVEGTAMLYRRLRAVVDGVPAPELERMRAEVAGLERWFGKLARGLEDLAGLKRALGS